LALQCDKQQQQQQTSTTEHQLTSLRVVVTRLRLHPAGVVGKVGNSLCRHQSRSSHRDT
jgi:hypothetical protein